MRGWNGWRGPCRPLAGSPPRALVPTGGLQSLQWVGCKAGGSLCLGPTLPQVLMEEQGAKAGQPLSSGLDSLTVCFLPTILRSNAVQQQG